MKKRHFGLNLFGTTLSSAITQNDNDISAEKKIHLFEAFESVWDFSSRLLSIVTAPVIGTVITAGLALAAAASVFWGLCNYLAFNKADGNKAMSNAKELAVYSLAFLAITLVGSLLNIADFAGAAWNSLPSCSEEDESSQDLSFA
ncbi:hypothetical protein Lqui_2693 [Legionella quinlivanii]|uniref:Uncharacterized protein n=1 Tax=Legionella quinlivanii TaxID=45073 RepID=A0A0W0XKY4_9GAMM|nr:hypothetical protein [Legionella quinlivanii]KTD45222.1 hypothetical protein Lqui_2693 [Legionella quinlivanii]SEG04704.1 hypothetical protein SAMN02746093_01733 [Legionella quinlivanii DSM 21216]STY11478.1 Uncharacterised protein [Legionella quinlivanii]